ncbi:uncharacterized protein LOC109809124 [Cajanus cajan]|uniref:uncharacterized protein LOC109809124 n=1 Tax=Cajanus cajan TaxID=3821 RepID=UPI00098D762C|nr:uncharacterized protein LOC109809124 [Cajanus cajan]
MKKREQKWRTLRKIYPWSLMLLLDLHIMIINAIVRIGILTFLLQTRSTKRRRRPKKMAEVNSLHLLMTLPVLLFSTVQKIVTRSKTVSKGMEYWRVNWTLLDVYLQQEQREDKIPEIVQLLRVLSCWKTSSRGTRR